RLVAEADALARAGKVPEALGVRRKVLAGDRDLFPAGDPVVIDSLQWVAELQEAQGDLRGARASRQEIRALQTRSHGPRSWQAAGARAELGHVERVAGLSRDQRQELVAAT